MTPTRKFDAANYLTDEETVAAYLEEIIETGEPHLIADALGAVARARGMSNLAKESGLSRENLYRTLSAKGNPELGTFLRIMKAMNMRISVEPVHHDSRPT